MELQPKIYEFEKMPFEQMNEKVFRRYIYGERALLCHFKFLKGAGVPEHQHDNEQITYVVKGKLRAFSGGKEFIISAGEVILFPANILHRVEALEDSSVIDVFSPPRKDWIEGTDTYFKK